MSVEIRTNLRFGGWHQLTDDPLRSQATSDRLLRIVLGDWVRYRGSRRVTATALCRESGDVRQATFLPFEQVAPVAVILT